MGGPTATNLKPEATQPAATAGAPAGGAGSAANGDTPAGGAAANNAPARLDLATLFTSHGLFGASGRIPVPGSSNGHLFVPAGAAGVAMANLGARMGLETTGITLPIASPADTAVVRDVRAPAVLAGQSPLAQEAERKLRSNDTAAAQSETDLAPGEGELRIVDDAFTRRPAVLARGDDAGATAALQALSDHFPNLWEQGKQYLSIEEIRYDLHRFFSLRSSSGQAAAALYHLDRWTRNLDLTTAKDVRAVIETDVADPALAAFVKRQFHIPTVETGTLHAGTKCCADLHYKTAPFHQAAPTFAEDIVIPWEGKRLLDAVKEAAAKIPAGQEVKLVARVSEGPEERRKLTEQLQQMLGAHASVEVLCAFKQGYSWLMDEIAPALAGKHVASLRIEFAKNVDPTNIRAMQSEARWVQELYPVDEMLARKLNIPLEKIILEEIEEPTAHTPTYRVQALDASGKEILARDFTVSTVMQPYNGVIPRYEQVQVETGWVRLETGGKVLLDQRIRTDIEGVLGPLPESDSAQVYQFVLSQAHGDLRTEFSPPFDTLKLDIHLSEPDYSLDLDNERISSLEALQEDTLYSTDVFISMMGDLLTGRPISLYRPHPAHRAPSEDGQGRPRAHRVLRQAGRQSAGALDLDRRAGQAPQAGAQSARALSGEMQPRLIQARVKAGEEGVERLTWMLPADFAKDDYDQWLQLEGQDQVDRNIFSVEQARGQLHWLEQMHAAGIYRDEVAYPHLRQMALEFDLPRVPHRRARYARAARVRHLCRHRRPPRRGP